MGRAIKFIQKSKSSELNWNLIVSIQIFAQGNHCPFVGVTTLWTYKYKRKKDWKQRTRCGLENGSLRFISSPEHKLLKVSYCGLVNVCRAMSTIALISFRWEIQDCHHGCHLENLFSASEPKGLLTLKSVGSVWVICRSKIAKIAPIQNPRWQQWPPPGKSTFHFSWIERLIDLELCRKYQSDF